MQEHQYGASDPIGPLRQVDVETVTFVIAIREVSGDSMIWSNRRYKLIAQE
jgi:hypothetical protein